ncbi:hypothetical protein PF008_g30820 [Phytophthora fragariae]|uniref:Uncharacterized protein n=1 Tax=Phytophthora fragariae TaxID=53985 RepID=A0A6G0Q4E4_9STRA|nr:hypothetical protein PF008_g30820 [Phytophthora fragariae]
MIMQWLSCKVTISALRAATRCRRAVTPRARLVLVTDASFPGSGSTSGQVHQQLNSCRYTTNEQTHDQDMARLQESQNPYVAVLAQQPLSSFNFAFAIRDCEPSSHLTGDRYVETHHFYGQNDTFSEHNQTYKDSIYDENAQ